MKRSLFFVMAMFLVPVIAHASSQGLPQTLLKSTPHIPQSMPQEVYEQAIVMAASGHEKEAIAHLQGAAAVLSVGDIWQERMALAAMLIDMRQHQNFKPKQFNDRSTHARLAGAYLKEHTRPEVKNSWLPGVLATIFPGAGHAWQGRWRDAWVAAIMIWPMIILTLWAARRRMGPVTLFFAMITAWLWSGSVFSAVSLAERGAFDLYLAWWQGLWQASALPGRPW